MKREFTGKHMIAVLVVGFGIVFAVNFTMAGLAIERFSGTVVDNSYVASQNFNDWLDEAERQKQLGWEVDVQRDSDGRLVAATKGVPSGARVLAEVRRPVGERETLDLALEDNGEGRFVSDKALPSGRWIARLTIAIDDRRMSVEEPIG